MGKSSTYKAPPPVNYSQEAYKFLFGDAGEYGTKGITDPDLQRRLVESEAQWTPEYIRNALLRQEATLFGVDTVSREDTPEYQKLSVDEYAANRDLRMLEQELSNLKGGRGNLDKSEWKRRVKRLEREVADATRTRDQIRQAMLDIPGVPDRQEGLLDIMRRSLPELQGIQNEATSLQRESEVADVERYGQRAVEAARAADPDTERLRAMSQAQIEEDLASRGALSGEARMRAAQDVREAMAARGLGTSNQSVFEEALNREQYRMGREDRARQAMIGQVGLNRATGVDPFMAILGRPAYGAQMAQNQQQFGAGFAGQNLGPVLFDPDIGANMALQQRGQDMEFMAANNSAQAGMFGSLIQGGATLGAAMLSDRRAKTNITKVGVWSPGVNIYEFEYRAHPGVRVVGVMADEVKKINPSAVIRGEDGYDRVDYSKI